MATPATPVKPAYPIGSVDNALRLLLLFRERESIRVAEASTELGVVRSTAHRLLAMLQYHDLVRQDPETKAYRAGPALWDIGLSVVRNMDLLAEVRPTLEELVNETGETAHVALLQGRGARCVDGIESPKTLKTGSRVGTVWPAHASAMGRALLAALPPERVRALYQVGDLEQPTPKAIASLDALERELERVRERGYATGFDELDADVSEVAIAQRNGAGVVRCALGISAPSARLNRRRVGALAEQMLAKAERLAPTLT
jgi:IclR family acetate operon transcriptional repressor